MPFVLKQKLTDILLKSGMLTPEQMETALSVQKKEGGKLSDVMIRLGYLKEHDLLAALGESLSIPPLDLSKLKIPEDVIKLVPEQIARRYQIIPISRVGNLVTVATSDPLNILALDEIRALTNFELNTVLGSETQIAETIKHYYQPSAGKEVEEIIAGMEDAQFQILADESETVDSQQLLRMIEETPVIKLTNMFLEESVRQGASDVLIEPLEKMVRVRYRVDGLLREGKSPPKSMHNALISRIKVMAELDIAERRLPKDGRFKVKLLGKEVDFRVSIVPTSFGEKVALRVLDKSSATLDLDRLGFETKTLERLKSIASQPHGMILACGPTGSGKTTTLYSILHLVDSPEKNLVTVEDPVEYQMPGINQVTIDAGIGLTFAACLRSILRQDPDVIMVGEIRDYDTVDITIKAALTGHLVLSTLHTTDAAGSIIRLTNMGVEPFLISSSLLAVVAQRLTRLICSNCKKPYQLTEMMRQELRFPTSSEEAIFYRGEGCRLCAGTGYQGRTIIAEVLPVTAGIRNLVMEKAAEGRIKELGRKEGMLTLREHGIMLARNGVTTLEEVLRLTAPDQPLGDAEKS